MIVAINDSVARATQRLEAAGIANARREARLLQALAAGDDARFAEYVDRRAGHEPYSRIRGKREFWSLDLELSPATLDPRPDSETLIEAALASLPDRNLPLHIVDLGTGTGALLLALLHEFRHATGIGVDILPDAAATARRNAAALGLANRAELIAADWSDVNGIEVDVVVANPPYIPDRELATLPPEVVCFDPRCALAGGADGLAAYRALAPVVHRILRPDGWAFFEVGAGQATAVVRIMTEGGLRVVGTRHDLAGHERCVVVRQEKTAAIGQKNRLASAAIPSRVTPPKAKEPRAPRHRRINRSRSD